VSPWWARLARRDTLRVELRPSEVLLHGRSFAIARDPAFVPPADETEEPWRADLDALAGALKTAGPALGRVAVVLSDHYARYLLLPWNQGLITDLERMAFARHAFREVYGADAEEWSVCLDEQPAGQPFFAAAVDAGLVSGLRDIVSHLGGRLASLTPALADCINRHRRVLIEPEFCLATVEAGRIGFAFRGRRGWSAVRSRRMEGGALPDVLPTLLKQEAVAGGVADGGLLYLCANGLGELPPFTVPGWRLVRLSNEPRAPRSTRRGDASLLPQARLKA